METRERRRNVRVRPLPELPVRAAFASGGVVRETLHVADLSVGGLALSGPALAGVTTGQTLKLVVILGATEEHTVDVVVRWVSGNDAGVELVTPAPTTTQALGRYVAEVLERGVSV